MSKKPDPGAGLAPAEAKEKRLKDWRRETTIKARKDAKKDRIAEWEKDTGLKHEVALWAEK